MLLNVYQQTVDELRKPVFTWTLAMLVSAALIVLAYPLADRMVDLDWLSEQRSASFMFGLAPAKRSMERLGEWLHAVGFGLVFPLLLAFYASRLGSWLVAGEEERGSLGMLLAAPITRTRFLAEKAAVLVVSVARPVLGLGLLLWAASWFGLHVAGAGLELLALFIFGLLFGGLALALGSATGRQQLSLAAALGGLLLAFLTARLPELLAAAGWLRVVSPLYYYDAADARPVLLLALAALALAAFGMAWASFDRRDLEI